MEKQAIIRQGVTPPVEEAHKAKQASKQSQKQAAKRLDDDVMKRLATKATNAR